MDSQAKDVMTVLELCEYLQMSEAKIREMLRQGTIPAVLIGRQWRIHRSAIDRWMAEQEGQRPVVKRREPRLGRVLAEAGGDREGQEPFSLKPPRRRSRDVEEVDAGARKPLLGAAPASELGDARTRRQLAQAAVKRDRDEKAAAEELARLKTTGSGHRARPGTGSRQRGKQR